MKRHAAFLFVFILFLPSCAFIPVATSHNIDKKVKGIALGDSRAKVAGQMGAPKDLAVIFNEAGDRYEILEYELGNYWYNEDQIYVFRNRTLIARLKSPFELLRVLEGEGLVGKVDFYGLYDRMNRATKREAPKEPATYSSNFQKVEVK